MQKSLTHIQNTHTCTHTARPLQVEEGESSSDGPAVTVTLNPLCHNVTYTVELSFGVRKEEQEEQECVPRQTVSATVLPGAAVLFSVDTTTLPLGQGQLYCYTSLHLNIEGSESHQW